MPQHILIATPAYGANVKIQYMESILRTQQLFARRGINHTFICTTNAEIVSARNFLSSRLYEQPQFTHLLFVDGDMSFAPTSVEALLAADKPLIGAVYPKKLFKPEAFAKSLRQQSNESLALASAFEFVFRVPTGTEKLEVTRGMCRVSGVGMGLCLVQQRVFEELMSTKKIAVYQKHNFANDGLEGPLLGFFDPLRASDGRRLSEDFSFCERWIELCGGEVWALASEVVSHIGDFVYRASFLDHLKSRSPDGNPD